MLSYHGSFQRLVPDNVTVKSICYDLHLVVPVLVRIDLEITSSRSEIENVNNDAESFEVSSQTYAHYIIRYR